MHNFPNLLFMSLQSSPVVFVQLAIESVTATHQLEAAVITLSKCVRPLLLTGSLKPLNKDIGIEQVHIIPGPWRWSFLHRIHAVCDFVPGVDHAK